MDNKNKIVILVFLIAIIILILLISNALQSPEKKIVKELGEAMVTREKFDAAYEKNFNYKAWAAVKKTLQNGDQVYDTFYYGDSAVTKAMNDIQAIANAVDQNYPGVTNEEIEAVKTELNNNKTELEIPYKKLKVDNISEEYEYIYMPCFKARRVTYKDSSGNIYNYNFYFYDHQIVSIEKAR